MIRLALILLFPLFTQCGEKARGQATKEEASKSMETEIAEKKLQCGSPVFIRAVKESASLSASPELSRQVSESLAGRVEIVKM